MRDYELVTILNPQLPEIALKEAQERVSRFVTEKGGAIQGVDEWGKRKLAYPINNLREGHYVLTRFSLDPKHTKELEDGLKLSEDVLRHLLVRIES